MIKYRWLHKLTVYHKSLSHFRNNINTTIMTFSPKETVSLTPCCPTRCVFPRQSSYLMFCRRHPPLCSPHERVDPTEAIWSKSLNVRTPRGNRRALAVAAIKSATQFEEDRSWVCEAKGKELRAVGSGSKRHTCSADRPVITASCDCPH